MRILFVDDEPAIRDALEMFFSNGEFLFHLAGDLETALSLLTTNTYDIILTDLRLTGTDSTEGLEILRYVRDRSPGTRTALLTGHGSPTVEARARALGVDLYLQKPIGLGELEGRLRELATLPSRSD